jgi:biotin-dependent carboxylase-like uncharacterized protein
LGVPRSGAFDRGAMRLANRLVGNRVGAAVLEVTFGGLTFQLIDAAMLALVGADCPGLGWGEPASLPAGSVVHLGQPHTGLRSYVAIRGGVDAERQLGSRSTDTLSGLGPAPLRAGDRLAVGDDAVEPVFGIVGGVATLEPVLGITLGPRDDWFEPASITALTETSWTVRSDSNRIGLRLDGPALRRSRADELPSEPTLPGAIQVPPDGRPILFGPDAPVTGGYPVIAVVRPAGLDIAAQLRPGDVVRFSRASDAERRRTPPPSRPPQES